MKNQWNVSCLKPNEEKWLKEEVPNYLDKCNFSGVVGMKTRSELSEERMSDEKVEIMNTALL